MGEVYRYIIESDQHSLRELTDLQNWVVIPRIKEVSGVADVTNFGGITTQFQVEIDPYKLEQYHLSLSQVIEAIENNNAKAGTFDAVITNISAPLGVKEVFSAIMES